MNRILELRQARKLSQADLAKFVGCTQVAISHYEKESRKIPPEVLAKLCTVFNVTADYLLGFSDENIKAPPHNRGEADLNSKASLHNRSEADLESRAVSSVDTVDFMRLQRASTLFLSLDDVGKAQALAHLEWLLTQQSREPEAQD